MAIFFIDGKQVTPDQFSQVVPNFSLEDVSFSVPENKVSGHLATRHKKPSERYLKFPTLTEDLLKMAENSQAQNGGRISREFPDEQLENQVYLLRAINNDFIYDLDGTKLLKLPVYHVTKTISKERLEIILNLNAAHKNPLSFEDITATVNKIVEEANKKLPPSFREPLYTLNEEYKDWIEIDLERWLKTLVGENPLKAVQDFAKKKKMKRQFAEAGAKAGVKHNQHKLPMSKLFEQFPNALQAVVLSSFYGANKYNETGKWDNFSKVEGGSKTYIDALFRHALDIENQDEESGLPHLFLTAWNSLAALELFCREKEIDLKTFSENYIKNLHIKE